MSSINRITKLAKIPAIRKKQWEANTREDKREDKSDNRTVFPLKGTTTIRKPLTNFRKQHPVRQSPKSVNDGVGERLDLKI